MAKKLITEATDKGTRVAGLEVERTLRELARVCYSDPREFFDDRGNLRNIGDLDDDSAAAIASFQITEEFGTGDQKNVVIGYTTKIKFWDKNSALDKAMKHLGLYEARKQQEPLTSSWQVSFVGSTPHEAYLRAIET